MNPGLASLGAFRSGFGWLGHTKQFAGLGNVVGAVAVRQQSVMPDAMEAFRQHVAEEAPDELGCGQRHGLEAFLAFDYTYN